MHRDIERHYETFRGYINNYTTGISHLSPAMLSHIASRLRYCRDCGGTVYLAGNGGSSSTASHIANDIGKGLGMQVKCLTDNTALLTAYSNDDSYESALSSILQQDKTSKDDLLIIISGSGNSRNVVKLAKDFSWINPVILTGFDGGELAQLQLESHLHIPIRDMQAVEDLHMMALHIIYRMVQES